MHLRLLVDHIKSHLGEPIETDRQDDACHWIIERPLGRAPIHLCLTLEQSTRRASVWVFDSDQPTATQTIYLQVSDRFELDAAVRQIDALIPASALA